MGVLELSRVGVRYGAREALADVELVVPGGQVLSLLGPSGCGKTSLLRVIAGLEPASAGRVRFDDRDLAEVPPHERGFGLMFQDYALFPHLDVAGNVGFGLRMAGLPATEVRLRVAAMLELVGLPGAEGRAVGRLSGGEQQRVALARALAPSPKLLMLDEPLGSLDRALRERLPLELRGIFERLGITVVYVTHDQEEAFSVADRTVILRGGRVEADGTPEELWTRPPTEFVARFLGFRNVAMGVLRAGAVDSPWGRLPAGSGAAAGSAEVTVVIRPDALSLAAAGPIGGVVAARRFRGDHVLITLAVADAPDLELELRGSPLPAVGDAVTLAVDPSGVTLIPA
jgi:thiamine transport system ATP-binding protein